MLKNSAKFLPNRTGQNQPNPEPNRNFGRFLFSIIIFSLSQRNAQIIKHTFCLVLLLLLLLEVDVYDLGMSLSRPLAAPSTTVLSWAMLLVAASRMHKRKRRNTSSSPAAVLQPAILLLRIPILHVQ